jgi:hypothetical protein
MRAIDFKDAAVASFVTRYDRGYCRYGVDGRYGEDELKGSGNILCFQKGTPHCVGKGFFLADKPPRNDEPGCIYTSWVKLP